MRTAVYLATWLAIGIVVLSGSASAAGQEQIGSWVLSCPGNPAARGPCLLWYAKRFLDKGGITGDLEVQAQGDTLVPVIALRGLSTEILAAASMAGKAEVSVQFAGGPRENLNCAVSRAGYICSPNDPGAQKLAEAMPIARSVIVRVSVAVTGMGALPAQERSLELSGTNEALARLRVAGPSQVPTPVTALASPSPRALIGMADKALKAAGYQNGVSDLQSLVTKYMKK